MIDVIVQYVTNLIVQAISSTGYTGIFILMALESALIPIPSEITMPFAGFLSTTGRFELWIVIFVGTFANLIGALVVYYLGYWGEKTFVHKLIKKYGKYILINEHELIRSEEWFRDHGEKIIFFSRVLPIVRTFISLPAGIAHMNVIRFSVLTFIGSLIWSILLSYIGFILGKNWNSLHPYYQKFEYIIVAGIVILVVYYLWHKFQNIKK